MKRVIPIIFISLYIMYILFMLSPGGEHHGHDMLPTLIGHITDHPIKKSHIPETDNPFVTIIESINNSIASLNENTLKNVKVSIGPLKGDMRITKWVMMMWLVVLLCVLVFVPVSYIIRKNKYGSTSRWINLWEALIGFVHDEIVEPNFDHRHVKRAMPYFASLFFFILFCNFLGLIPGMSTATASLMVTGGLAILTFIAIFAVGFAANGPLWLFTGVVPKGVPLLILPLLFVIEMAGFVIKPFALTIRLFANMTAGHIVILIFLLFTMQFHSYAVGVASVMGSLMIYLLELLVAFIQAYIFTALSAMFIGQSMHTH